MSDFVIKNGVLTKYVGKGGDVVVPDGVTAIGEKAFFCDNLMGVTIPDSVTEIGDEAFTDCTNLQEVVIPSSVKTIGSWAFAGCENLKRIVIPDETFMARNALFMCENLCEILSPNEIAEKQEEKTDV